MKKTCTYQIVIAVVLVGIGVLLIIVAFIVPPAGVIDPTGLTAFGEMLTFSGASGTPDPHEYRYFEGGLSAHAYVNLP